MFQKFVRGCVKVCLGLAVALSWLAAGCSQIPETGVSHNLAVQRFVALRKFQQGKKLRSKRKRISRCSSTGRLR